LSRLEARRLKESRGEEKEMPAAAMDLSSQVSDSKNSFL
jgi:hypothetical protein